MQNKLFHTEPDIKKGAQFSECGKYRYSLYRIWDENLPLIMVIGLNPSTANHETDDPTIQSVTRLAKFNGYGGFYMTNCWSYISTDPDELVIDSSMSGNIRMLYEISKSCKDVLFAWGNFDIVKKMRKDQELIGMFPDALCITKNKNGSPGHPLFKKGTIKFFKYINNK